MTEGAGQCFGGQLEWFTELFLVISHQRAFWREIKEPRAT